MTDSVFKDTHQAIQFSYMVEGLPVRQDSALGKAIQQAMREAGLLEPTERSSINFEGLTDLEVRAQAAMVRLAVEALLPGPESWAIRSRYGCTKVIRCPGGEREAVFSEGRLLAMRSLTAYLSASFDTIPHTALMLIIARICAESDELRPTFRDIEAEAGSSKSTLERAEKKIKARIRELMNAGIDRLTPIFEREGLVAQTYDYAKSS